MPTQGATGQPLPRLEAQLRTVDSPLVMLHRWLSADDNRWLLEKFPGLESTLGHLDRCADQITPLTVRTGAKDRGLGRGWFRLRQRLWVWRSPDRSAFCA